MNDLSSLFALLAEEKKKKKEIEDKLKQSIKEDVNSLFSQLSGTPEPETIVEQIEEEVQEQVLTEVITNSPAPEIKEPNTMDSVGKYLTGKSFQQPESDKVAPELRAVTEKIKFLEQWISKINNAGPGGGEVNLRYLDDVARETIADGRWLKYDASRKKFVFDEINPFEVVENTTEVTTSTYTVTPTDFYIGVNFAGPVTITLPASANSGRMLIIKDEDGDAETNPITVLGTVDNDAGGFIIQINNGAIQLLYRNGWRIV